MLPSRLRILRNTANSSLGGQTACSVKFLTPLLSPAKVSEAILRLGRGRQFGDITSPCNTETRLWREFGKQARYKLVVTLGNERQ